MNLKQDFQSSTKAWLPLKTSSLCTCPSWLTDISRSYFSKHLNFSEKSNFDAELARWRMKHVMEAESEQEGAMPDCSPQEFPAIHKVLSIFLTTPVGSVSCERSFSALRRLKLWTRSSMTEDRLSGLAMLLIHRGTSFIPTPKEIYDRKSNWRRI